MDKIVKCIVDKTNVGIIVIDDKQKIVIWNKWLENYSGLTVGEVINRPLIDVMPVFRKAYYQQIIDNALLRGQGMFCSGALHPVFIPHRDQTLADYVKQNMQIEPIMIAEGSYLLIQINDITNQYKQIQILKKEITERKRIEQLVRKSEEEMKKLRDEALAASQAKSEFLAIMSHEIRTPMNAILGMADLLAETLLDEEQREYVELLRSSGGGLLHILNDILDVSKIEAGKLGIYKKGFDLEALLKEIVAVFSYQAQIKGIEFIYEQNVIFPSTVFGDAVRLQQVINNLLANAIKFTQEGYVALIVSSLEKVDGYYNLEFSVRDTGIGIPAEKVNDIFEPFTQVDSSTSRKFGGTGLGLAIVKRLVGYFNGEIAVDSHEGKGSTFVLRIQLEAEEVAGQQPAAEAAMPNGSAATSVIGKRRILIAEDSEENIRLILAYLKEESLDIDIVTNGRDALAKSKGFPYDLILMDIEMPEMSGLEAIVQIRDWEKLSSQEHMPIITLTAHALDEYQQRSMEAGSDGMLIKPVKKQELLACIREILDKKHGYAGGKQV